MARDAQGNPVPNTAVAWQPVQADAQISNLGGITGPDGRALGVWRLGADPGQQAASAALVGSDGTLGPPVIFTAFALTGTPDVTTSTIASRPSAGSWVADGQAMAALVVSDPIAVDGNSLALVAGPPALDHSQLFAPLAAVVADGSSPALSRLLLRDAQDNPCAGLRVSLALSGLPGALSGLTSQAATGGLASFAGLATAQVLDAGGIGLALSPDNSRWFWYNGSTWAAGTGSFYFRAFLLSNGLTSCALDRLQVSVTQ